MRVRTITLTGAEKMADGLNGAHAHIRNDGADIIYASKSAGIIAGADGVIAIPAGNAAALYGISGEIYLSGTGAATVVTSDYVESPFKASAQAGGSGADEVARAAISSHAGNAEAHVSAEEKAAWNGKADVSDINNPNLLINPDFAVNQRGQAAYNAAGYTVDCWKLMGSASVTVNSGAAITFSADGTEWAELRQTIDNGITARLDGKILTLSAVVDGIFYSGTTAAPFDKTKNSTPVSVTCGDFSISLRNIPTNPNSLFVRIGSSGAILISPEYIKLEVGSKATPNSPPDPAAELAKCQRYYQVRSAGDIAAIDLRPTMRATPAVTQLSDGNYAYSAEI